MEEAAIRAPWEAGDFDAAMSRAVERYGDELFGFLVGLSGDRDRAGDVFSAMCERAWRALPRFRWESTVRVWMYTIARNEFRRAATSPRQHVPLSMARSVDEAVAKVRTGTAPHLRTDVKSEFARIREALDPEDHMLLGLRLDRGLPWNEIAQIMGSEGGADLTREAAALRKRYERLKVRLKELAASLVADHD